MSGVDFLIGSEVGDVTTDYEYSEANVLEVIRKEKEPSFEEFQRIQNKNLSERISKVDHGIYTYSTIDKVVQVKTFSDTIIKQKVDFWNNRRINNRNRALLGGVIAIAGLFFAATISPPFGGILGIAGSFYSFYALARMGRASSEVEAWKQNHVQGIAEQRRKALELGLIFIYKQDTAGISRPQEYQKILSKNELQGLYNRYFHQFKDRLEATHDDKTKLTLLSEATRYSPLASHIYRYALTFQEKIDQMEEIRVRYNNFLRAYNSVDSRIQTEINRVKESFKIPVEMVQEEKKELLKPVEARYAAEKERLLNLKTSKLEGSPPIGVEIPDYHRQVEREFSERYKAAEQTYKNEEKEALKRPNEKLQEIEAKKKEVLARIHSDRTSQLLPLFPYVQALHQEAYKLYKGEVFNLIHLHRDPETVFPTYPSRYGPAPRPSAPPLPLDEWQKYMHDSDPQMRRY